MCPSQRRPGVYALRSNLKIKKMKQENNAMNTDNKEHKSLNEQAPLVCTTPEFRRRIWLLESPPQYYMFQDRKTGLWCIANDHWKKRWGKPTKTARAAARAFLRRTGVSSRRETFGCRICRAISASVGVKDINVSQTSA